MSVPHKCHEGRFLQIPKTLLNWGGLTCHVFWPLVVNHPIWWGKMVQLIESPQEKWLVGGIPTPSEKYDFVSWEVDIPNMWKVIKFHGSKPPTRWWLSHFTSHFWWISKPPTRYKCYMDIWMIIGIIGIATDGIKLDIYIYIYYIHCPVILSHYIPKYSIPITNQMTMDWILSGIFWMVIGMVDNCYPEYSIPIINQNGWLISGKKKPHLKFCGTSPRDIHLPWGSGRKQSRAANAPRRCKLNWENLGDLP